MTVKIRSAMISIFAIMISLSGIFSFIVPGHVQTMRRYPIHPLAPLELPPRRIIRTANVVIDASNKETTGMQHTWSPQDLTKDNPGFVPIPDSDYVKKYQKNPELWPVEFFLIVHRRTKSGKTQVLVRESANGTSKWGVGTGVPATRCMLSSTKEPPRGYKRSEPRIGFEASNFPEFPKNGGSWSYDKIEIRENAFNGSDVAAEFKDPELEEYANKIRNHLRTKLSSSKKSGEENSNSWESSRISVVKNVVDKPNSVAAIQGTLRMSGLFGRRKATLCAEQQNGVSAIDAPRCVSLGQNAPDPAELVRSMQIYTMFPQMPSPMPLPSTPPEELREEIASRESTMEKTGRDPHKDEHGRKFTHRSTNNVSNTIHGVYFSLDATDLAGIDDVPALDLFGTKEIEREWKSLEDLRVLDPDGKTIGTEDTKPTFISGFVVRQLVKDGVIDIRR